MAIGIAIFGFLFEAVSDWQLSRFKAGGQNKGKLLTTGLWSLSRHPNYFGDATFWWGIFGLALNSDLGFMAIPGPILMSYLLTRVSGVPLLEQRLAREKPAYRWYIESTPVFFPDFSKLWR